MTIKPPPPSYGSSYTPRTANLAPQGERPASFGWVQQPHALSRPVRPASATKSRYGWRASASRRRISAWVLIAVDSVEGANTVKRCQAGADVGASGRSERFGLCS